MKTTTHRLIITGLAALSLVTIALTPALSEAQGSTKRNTTVTKHAKRQTSDRASRSGSQVHLRCPGQGASFQLVPPLPNPFAEDLRLPQTWWDRLERWPNDEQRPRWVVAGDF
jgi:hypothetical protein